MIKFNIIDSANQKFSAIVSSRRITIRLRYNPSIDRWHFDLALDGDYVLHGRKIINNVDLLAPYNFDIGVIFAYSNKDQLPIRESIINGEVGIFHASNGEMNESVST